MVPYFHKPFSQAHEFIQENLEWFTPLLKFKGQILKKPLRSSVSYPLDLAVLYWFPTLEDPFIHKTSVEGVHIPPESARSFFLFLKEFIQKKPLLKGLFAANILNSTRKALDELTNQKKLDILPTPLLKSHEAQKLHFYLSKEERFFLNHHLEYIPLACDFYLKGGLSFYQFFPLRNCKGADEIVAGTLKGTHLMGVKSPPAL